MSPILNPVEAAWTVDIDRVDTTVRALIRQVLGEGGEEEYRAAVVALASVPREELWLVELCCEAELSANSRPVHEPCGLRRVDYFS
jgi:hypothetical protein